jgi:hypothetical protein
MTIDKQSLNIVRRYLGDNFMTDCITNIDFARKAFFELDKHEAKVMRMPRTPENQTLKIAYRKIQGLVKHLLSLSDRRQNVRKAMIQTYYYTQIHDNGANTIRATYQDLLNKFSRVKVEVIKIGGTFNQIIDSTYKVNNVSSDIWNAYSYIEKN